MAEITPRSEDIVAKELAVLGPANDQCVCRRHLGEISLRSLTQDSGSDSGQGRVWARMGGSSSGPGSEADLAAQVSRCSGPPPHFFFYGFTLSGYSGGDRGLPVNPQFDQPPLQLADTQLGECLPIRVGVVGVSGSGSASRLAFSPDLWLGTGGLHGGEVALDEIFGVMGRHHVVL